MMKKRAQIIVLTSLMLSILILSFTILSHSAAIAYKPLKYSASKEIIQNIDDDLQRLLTNLLSTMSINYNGDISSIREEAREELIKWQKIIMRAYAPRFANIRLTIPVDFLNFQWGWPRASSSINANLKIDILSLGLSGLSKNSKVCSNITFHKSNYTMSSNRAGGFWNLTYTYNLILTVNKEFNKPNVNLKSSNFHLSYTNYDLTNNIVKDERENAVIKIVAKYPNGTYVISAQVYFIDNNKNEYDRLFKRSNVTISVLDERGILVKLNRIRYVTPITLILRPNSAGTYQQWTIFNGGNRWSVTSDQNDTTGVMVTGSTTLKETQNLTDITPGEIKSVTAYVRAKVSGETMQYDTITFDSAASTRLTSTASSMSWSHTTGSGSNGILLVDIGTFSTTNPATVTSVTYGGRELTLVKTDAYSTTSPMVRSYLYMLVNPPQGTHTISVTFSALTLAVGGSVTYFNVDQTNPIQVSGSSKGSGTTQSISLTSTGTYNKIFHASMMSYRTTSPPSYKIDEGSGQTVRWSEGKVGDDYKGRASSKSVAEGTQTMYWSTDKDRPVSWVSIGAILIPTSSNPIEQAVILWRTYNRDYESSPITISRTTFTDYSEVRTTNPYTNNPWTWDEINALEIGCRASTLGATETLQVSEIWAVIEYIPD